WAGIACSATTSRSCGSGSAMATCSGRPRSRRWPGGLRRREPRGSASPAGAMTYAQSLIAFIAAAGVLTVTPGVDTAMVLRFATVGGPRRAALAGVGISLGCLVWGASVALGLGALLAASEFAFSVVKVAGAAYLLWLGLGLLWEPRQGFLAHAPPPQRTP